MRTVIVHLGFSGNAPKGMEEEIMKIKDTVERQKAIAENPGVFGLE